MSNEYHFKKLLKKMRKSLLIHDIDMDHFGQADGPLATSGLVACVRFVVILNQGQNVFIEHRSDVFLPVKINEVTVRSLLDDVIEHISKVLPKFTIMAVLILGGYSDDERFKSLQQAITNAIERDVGTDNDHRLFNRQQFLKNIILSNVQFNKPQAERLNQETGESAIDLVVDRSMKDGERVIGIIQHITRFGGSDTFIGVVRANP